MLRHLLPSLPSLSFLFLLPSLPSLSFTFLSSNSQGAGLNPTEVGACIMVTLLFPVKGKTTVRQRATAFGLPIGAALFGLTTTKIAQDPINATTRKVVQSTKIAPGVINPSTRKFVQTMAIDAQRSRIIIQRSRIIIQHSRILILERILSAAL